MRWLLGVAAVVAVCGCNSGSSPSGDTNPANQKMVFQAGVAPSSKELDASKVEVKVVNHFWNGYDRTGKPLYRIDYRIINNTGRPLAEFSVKFDFSLRHATYTTSATHTPRQHWNVARSITGMTPPGMRSHMQYFQFNPDERYVDRDDVVIKATPFACKEMVILEDHPQNYDQMAWMMYEGDMAKIKAAYDKNPKLLEVKTLDGYGPLAMAVMAGNIELVKYLQSLGADIKATGPKNDNALHWAAYASGEMVDYVKSQGVRPTTTFDTRETPYFNAIASGKPDVVAALKRAGAPINALTAEKVHPIAAAIFSQEPEVVEALVASGANKDFVYDNRLPLLCLSASAGREQFFARMVKLKGTIKEVAPDGNTPLHLAVMSHNTNVIQWILLNGGDSTAKNKAGQTAKDIAAQSGMRDVLDIFANPKKPL